VSCRESKRKTEIFTLCINSPVCSLENGLAITYHLIGLYYECVFGRDVPPLAPYNDWEAVFRDLSDRTHIGYNDRLGRLLSYLAGNKIFFINKPGKLKFTGVVPNLKILIISYVSR